MKKKKRLKRKLDVKSKSKKKKSRSSSKRRYDSKKLQKRLKRSQERAQGGMKSVVKADAEVQMYRPKDGGHIVDIIPYEAGEFDSVVEEGDPTYTLEIWVHPQVGTDKAVMLCMERMFNKPCAICDHRQTLRDKGTDEEVWKKLFPKGRHLYNVISYDKGEEKKGVQVWDVSYHYSEKHIIPLSKRPTRGGKERTVNFADPIDGKSIAFTIEPAKSKNDYPSYTGWAFEDRDYEIEDELMDDAHTLDEIIHIPTAKEVSDAYWGKDGKKKKSSKRDKDDDGDDESLEELIEEVEDMDDMEDLEDFIDEHDLDIKIKRKDDEEDVQEKIKEALEEEYGENDDDDDDDDEPDYTKKEIRKMKKKKLLKLIEDEDLDVDEDDAEDTEELQDMVIEELEL